MTEPGIPRRATIREVAAAAGVSSATVSNVLNGHPKASPETRARVRAAAATLGWQPLAAARSLRSARSHTVGLVLARTPDAVGDDFYSGFVAGLHDAVANDGFVVCLQVANDPDHERELYTSLVRRRRVDGFVLTDERVDEYRPELLDQELDVPWVLTSRLPYEGEDQSYEGEDQPYEGEVAGIAELAAHLVELGHSRIGYIGGPADLRGTIRRVAALTTALEAAGCPAPVVHYGDFTAMAARDGTAQLLARRRPPTALVYGNDDMALAGMALAGELGHRVPTDLSIAGQDNILLGRLNHPALTTTSADPFGLGHCAGQTLVAKLLRRDDAPTPLPRRHAVLRQSTGPAAR
ncbi:LacI family DNA-binding transcriptional regulator [Microlunatus sp. Y2014]|uniref:LacI family DNA-binding transcriptional regulator n=1 Tax=Microlunatus sp. Y2014 TaxID=3418488 RepID=UPI003DA72CDE